jgi:hypothetical protein
MRNEISREFANWQKPPNPRPPVPVNDHGGLVIAGWITTFLLAPVGFIIGVILTAKGRTGHWVAQMCVCTIWIAVAVAVSFSSGDTATIYQFESETPTYQVP